MNEEALGVMDLKLVDPGRVSSLLGDVQVTLPTSSSASSSSVSDRGAATGGGARVADGECGGARVLDGCAAAGGGARVADGDGGGARVADGDGGGARVADGDGGGARVADGDGGGARVADGDGGGAQALDGCAAGEGAARVVDGGAAGRDRARVIDGGAAGRDRARVIDGGAAGRDRARVIDGGAAWRDRVRVVDEGTGAFVSTANSDKKLKKPYDYQGNDGSVPKAKFIQKNKQKFKNKREDADGQFFTSTPLPEAAGGRQGGNGKWQFKGKNEQGGWGGAANKGYHESYSGKNGYFQKGKLSSRAHSSGGGDGLRLNSSVFAAPSYLPGTSYNHTATLSSTNQSNAVRDTSRMGREEMLKSFINQHCPNVNRQLYPQTIAAPKALESNLVPKADDVSKLPGVDASIGSEPGLLSTSRDQLNVDMNGDASTSIAFGGVNAESDMSDNLLISGVRSMNIATNPEETVPTNESKTSRYQNVLQLEAILFAPTPTHTPQPLPPSSPYKPESFPEHITASSSSLASSEILNGLNGLERSSSPDPPPMLTPVKTVPSSSTQPTLQTPTPLASLTPSSTMNMVAQQSQGESGAETRGSRSFKDLIAEVKQRREAAHAESLQLLEKRNKQVNSKTNAAKGLFNKNKVPRKILEQTRRLPIYTCKDELIELIKHNQFIIVIGETGSGKSTQLPQYLAEAGLNGNRKIGVTQPRRVAAKSLAERVAVECGVKTGNEVGYAVRFDKKVSGKTVIKYMTDGLLVKECATEANLDTYSIIIIDEAHERSIHTDVCFGLLKRAAKKRRDLKVIISSATLEEGKFKDFFNAPVFNVSGKRYDVEILYEPKTECDYIEGAVDKIININRREPPGDILVFLPGQEEIEKVWEIASSLDNDLVVIPCYGALPFEDQQIIFEETPPNCRKVVLATNIAETSLTIDGIVYVIDCGFCKQNEYNPRSGIYSLVTQQITKFQAIQRAGRAGRTRAGKCYRLYSIHDFRLFMEATSPEITRCNLESIILDIICMGISDPLNFEFMDQPPHETLVEAMLHLLELGALDDDLKLTDLGRRMAEFPLDPPLAKVVIESEKLGCSSQVLKIVALLSTQYHNLFSRNKRDLALSDQAKARFINPNGHGDLLLLLKIYDDWLSNKKSENWCKSLFIQQRILVEADEIRQQLKDILSSRGIDQNLYHDLVCPSSDVDQNIRKAFTAGYFRQLAKKKDKGNAYLVLSDARDLENAYIHPSSSLFHDKNKHTWVMYHEILKTTRTFMRGVFTIEPEWITVYAPLFATKVASHGVPT